MRVSSSALRVLTSLRLGERVLVRSDDGLLAAEYALFDGTDIVLRASDPVSVREAGYMTTAHEALGRLARVGITPGLASEAARAMAPEVAVSFARGSTARNIVPRLTAYELFEGRGLQRRSAALRGRMARPDVARASGGSSRRADFAPGAAPRGRHGRGARFDSGSFINRCRDAGSPPG